MKRKKFATAVIATTMTLAACTGGSNASSGNTDTSNSDSDTSASTASQELSGNITFQTWSLKNDRFTPYFEDLIAQFEDENPGVTINWIDQPGDGYDDKILQQAESGELPDVVNIPPDFAYLLAQADMLQNLDDVAGAPLSDYVQGGVDAYSYPEIDGHYGYPWYLGTDIYWFNTALLDEAGVDTDNLPNDLDSLFSMALDVAEATNGEVTVISDVPTLDTLAQAGVELFDGEQFVFDTPEAVEVIQRYKDAYAAGAMPPEALNADYAGNSQLYIEGKTAFTTGTPGFASQLATDQPSLLETSVPRQRIGNAPLYIQGISVSASSEAPEAAAAFAQFVTNNENQVEFVKIAQGFFPGTNEANNNPESFTSVIENPVQVEATAIGAEAMKTAAPATPLEVTVDMSDYFKQQTALAVRGDISIEEALQKSVDYANQNLE